MKRDHTKQVERATSTDQLDNIRELTLTDLDMVAGSKGASGKLFQACCTGKHFAKATLSI
jgi:type VI protein secretion system component Hcp